MELLEKCNGIYSKKNMSAKLVTVIVQVWWLVPRVLLSGFEWLLQLRSFLVAIYWPK